MLACQYNTSRYNFYKHVQDVLGVEKLNGLKLNDEQYTVKTDQDSLYHKKWYNGDITGFLDSYKKFLKVELLPKVRVFWHGERLVYQAKPTIRFQYPGNLAVGEFHRDRDYAHNPAEINVFLPMTLAYGNSTMWIESEEGKEDFRPMNGGYGDYIFFSGANLKHGNKLNDTGFCRVSFDFRIVPYSKYEEWGKLQKESVTTGKKMVVGDYYEILE